jgi:hypothetical protein
LRIGAVYGKLLYLKFWIALLTSFRSLQTYSRNTFIVEDSNFSDIISYKRQLLIITSSAVVKVKELQRRYLVITSSAVDSTRPASVSLASLNRMGRAARRLFFCCGYSEGAAAVAAARSGCAAG